jgi:hypothetical protein
MIHVTPQHALRPLRNHEDLLDLGNAQKNRGTVAHLCGRGFTHGITARLGNMCQSREPRGTDAVPRRDLSISLQTREVADITIRSIFDFHGVI